MFCALFTFHLPTVGTNTNTIIVIPFRNINYIDVKASYVYIYKIVTIYTRSFHGHLFLIYCSLFSK